MCWLGWSAGVLGAGWAGQLGYWVRPACMFCSLLYALYIPRWILSMCWLGWSAGVLGVPSLNVLFLALYPLYP
jgi:hypothetical protein